VLREGVWAWQEPGPESGLRTRIQYGLDGVASAAYLGLHLFRSPREST